MIQDSIVLIVYTRACVYVRACACVCTLPCLSVSSLEAKKNVVETVNFYTKRQSRFNNEAKDSVTVEFSLK